MTRSMQDFEFFKRVEALVRELYKRGSGVSSIYIDHVGMEIKLITRNGTWNIKFEEKDP
jgi:hypothetical protein